MTGKLGKTKKKTIKIMSIVLAAALLVGGIGGYCLFSVKAQGILTGLESKVSEKVVRDEAFRILEVVPDGSRGEIGNLVKGQEADFRPDGMDDYLTEHPELTNSNKVREEYINELKGKLAAYCGNNQPFSGNAYGYAEKYFLEEEENTADYQVMTFSPEHYETVTLKGSYELVSGQDGNYMPNFSKVQASDTGSYKVTFSTEERTDTREELYHQTYVIRTVDGSNVYVADTPTGTDITYYIQECTYVGTGSTEGKYDPIPDTLKPYRYVAEGGIYQFVPHDSQSEQTVEIGKVFYQGGIINNDWFRTKILASANSSGLQFEVTTITESELASYDLSNVDMVYLCSDTTGSELEYNNRENVWNRVKSLVGANVPCVLDAETGIQQHCGDDYAKGYSNQNDFVQGSLYIMQTKEGEERKPIYHNLLTEIGNTDGVGEVSSFIKSENTMRSGEDRLSEDITRLFLLQYIIDYSQQRDVGTKESFRVLEIQPTMARAADTTTTGFELTTKKVAQWAGVSEDTDIVIDSMSTAEFIGKIDDLNEEYDLIYFGADISNLNTESGKTVYNDPRMNGLIYTHTGDYVLGKPNISGMLDTDYGAAYVFGKESRDNNYYLYDNVLGYEFLKNRTIYTNGLLTQELKKVSLQTKYADLKITFDDLCGDLSVYRYSGNDITKTKLADLLEYVDANYPVVVSDALYNMDANGTKTVNEDTVDNTSYLYQFLSQIQGEENVFSVSQVNDGNSEVGTYLNLPKLEILYFNPDTPKGEMKAYEGIDTKAGDLFNKDKSNMKVDTSNADNTGTYTVKVGFYLDSNVDASAASVYIPKFYLDLNADGKFLESGKNGSSEQMSCVIYNVDTGVDGVEAPKDDSGKYQLTSGVRYRLEREIPSTYLGVLSWKLEMVQAANESIRTSDTQYTKIDGKGKEEVVKVLQITSQSSSGSSNNLIDLATDETIRDYLEQVKKDTGLKFEIDTVGGGDFGNNEAKNAGEFYSKKLSATGKSLEDYDMLILGFADMYYDISNKCYAVDAINLFIKNGKSVLFSHDVTSFINVNPDHSFKNIGAAAANNINQKEWGYYMNEKFRSVLGMDRYGIASDTNASDSEKLREQSELLRQGQHLTVNVQTGHATVNQCINTKNNRLEYFVTRGLIKTEEKLSSERDIAYAAKTYDSTKGTAQAYGQTHGFTNALLNWYLQPSGYTDNSGNPYNSDGQVNAKVTKENDGLITHFPFEIGDSFRTAKTHFQYYQLHMDQDVDGDSEGDVVVWYCLSDDADNPNSEKGKVYRNSPNDARNNYYIYNIGNVTYTGMGHSNLNHSGKDLETKLYINTMVAAYKAGVEPPTIKILESAEKTSDEKKYEYITYDNAVNGALTGDVSFYFTITDPNLTSAQKNLTVDFSYNLGKEDKAIDSKQVEVTDVTTKTPVSGSYTEGHVYYAKIHGMESLIQQEDPQKKDPQIKATVHCSFNYYGKVKEHTATAGLTVVKSELFNLN